MPRSAPSSRSGLPTSEFQFLGFLPEKTGARRTRLEDLAAEPRQGDSAQTLIFYEAPHRILDTLGDLEFVWGPDLRIALARELTKLHEEFLRGTAAEIRKELASRDRIRGEFVLLIEAPPRSKSAGSASGHSGLGTTGAASEILEGTQARRESISSRVSRLQAESGIDEKEALKRLARELGQSKSELYRELQRERARRK